MADDASNPIEKLASLAARAGARLPLGEKMRTRLNTMRSELDRMADPDGAWGHFAARVEARYATDASAFDDAEKRRLFKDMVRLVEFEPHAYCNRLCPFCPNIDGKRIKDHSPMDFAVYRRTIGDLAAIGYDGIVRFARYSEPLACKTICDYVSVARAGLPNAEIDIVSNGDYLDADLLDRLADAGLSILRISIYPKGYDWNVAAARDQLDKLLKRAKTTAKPLVEASDRLYWRIAHPRVEVYAEAADLNRVGYDRGQTLEKLIDRSYVRKSPCTMVFTNLTIDFNGAVMPCCNLRSDVPEHKDFVVDVVSGNRSIFDVYASKAMSEWRASLARAGAKKSPCDTCKQKAIDDPVALALLDRRLAARLADG
ncbi:MAG: radical SAM/SPASM domain-containing protein [Alphaproteobacteria bacterium]|nr:radical SAM/SPASM domain-containing protein [Alphaproteobacteria bacterium]